MKIYRSIDVFPHTSKKMFFTLGVFDGIHIGHQKILRHIVHQSKRKINRESILLSFFPHPKYVLFNKRVKYLTTIREKILLCSLIGLDHLIIQYFSKEFSCISYMKFIEFLYSKIKIKYFVMGYDNFIGNNREGSYKKIKNILDIKYIILKNIEPVKVNNIYVKSSYIKNTLLKGDLLLANKLLGYSYIISGRIIKGDGMGAKLGFPTANLQICHNKLLPKIGVYAVIVHIYNLKYIGMLNIGYRPTVIDNSIKRVEVHIFDFQRYAYHEFIYINIVQFIREEYKFYSISRLSDQLRIDKERILQDYSIYN